MNRLTKTIRCPYCGMKLTRYASVIGNIPNKIVTANPCQLIDRNSDRTPKIDEKGNILYKGCGKPIKVIFEKNSKGRYIGKVIL